MNLIDERERMRKLNIDVVGRQPFSHDVDVPTKSAPRNVALSRSEVTLCSIFHKGETTKYMMTERLAGTKYMYHVITFMSKDGS